MAGSHPVASLLACCKSNKPGAPAIAAQGRGRYGILDVISNQSFSRAGRAEERRADEFKLLQAEEVTVRPRDDGSEPGLLEGEQDRSPGRTAFLFCLLSFCAALLATCAIGGLAFIAPSSAVGRLTCGVPTINQSSVAVVADKYFRNYPFLGWWSMPDVQPQALLKSLHSKLKPYAVKGYPGRLSGHCPNDAAVSCSFPEAKLTWASASAREIASAMYMATSIKGIVSQVPEKLRGVFWVRGGDSSMGLEALAVVQYGRWFPDERIYILPQAPFTRAWPASAPGLPPESSEAAIELGRLHQAALSSRYAHTVVWAFQSKSLSFADVETCKPFGAVRGEDPPQAFEGSRAFTLEELPSSMNGTVWKRGYYAGWNGCNPLDTGSYEMVKIISANGNYIQPHYSEFLAYFSSTDLFVHSGWETEAGREVWANWYYSMTGGKPTEDTLALR